MQKCRSFSKKLSCCQAFFYTFLSLFVVQSCSLLNFLGNISCQQSFTSLPAILTVDVIFISGKDILSFPDVLCLFWPRLAYDKALVCRLYKPRHYIKISWPFNLKFRLKSGCFFTNLLKTKFIY